MVNETLERKSEDTEEVIIESCLQCGKELTIPTEFDRQLKTYIKEHGTVLPSDCEFRYMHKTKGGEFWISMFGNYFCNGLCNQLYTED